MSEISAIFIPTYRRPKQYSYDNLPEKWKKRSFLVVDEEDQERLKKQGYQTLLCDKQGHGTSPVREWIARFARKNKVKHYGVFDDDIYNYCYTRLATQKEEYPLWNTKMTPEHFDEAFALMEEWLSEGFVTCGLEVCWNPPLEKLYHQNFRQTVTHFFNDERLPLDELSFSDIECAEDYNILLQLLTKGYENRVSLRYRTRPLPTQQSTGGSSGWRTIEIHNRDMEKLQAKFPDFVKLYEKTTKKGVGTWGGQTKLACEVMWKKAYKSSQIVPARNVLEAFA